MAETPTTIGRRHILDRLSGRPMNGRRSDYDLDPGLARTHPPEGEARRAAVLVPIIERRAEMTVLLTLRTDHLPSHAGQVSFPGGSCDPDDPHATHTALREAEEEVGLDPAAVEIAGKLDPYRTGTGYLITPVVGLIAPPVELKINPEEVAQAFEVPLQFLIDPANRKRHRAMWKGVEREYYAMPYEDYYIWGATAGMIVNLADVLA